MTGSSRHPAAVGYTLRVDGRLDGRWATRFDGFTLTAGADGTTTLTGVVADQAQLHGLLATIRDLGLELISLEAGKSSPRGGTSTRDLHQTPPADPRMR